MNAKSNTYVCYAVSVFFAIALTVISPLLTEISRAYSLSLAESGLIFTVNFLGFLIFVIIGGILADVFGKKKVLAVSLAGFSVSLLLLPLSSSFAVLCLLMLFLGGFIGILESQTSALVSQLNPENPSFYVNMSQVFFGVGAVIGPITAGIVISAGVSWRIFYLVFGILSVILSLVFASVKSTPEVRTASVKQNTGAKIKVKSFGFILICVCMVFYTGSEVGGWGWMSTFLKEDLSFSTIKSGAAVGLFWVAMTLGRLLCGSLTFKFKIRHIILVLSAASTVVTVLSGLVASEPFIWLVIIAMGLAYSSQWPLIVAYGGEYSGSNSGIVFSLLVGGGSVGSMIIPYLMGVIGQYANMKLAMVSPSVFFLLIFLIFISIKKKSV